MDDHSKQVKASLLADLIKEEVAYKKALEEGEKFATLKDIRDKIKIIKESIGKLD